MGITAVPILTDEMQYVYAAFCEGGESGSVKFGVTKSPRRRLEQLKTACPFPISMFAGVQTGRSRRIAVYCERELHRKFIERSTHGEWFRFVFASPEDKRAFNDGCREVFRIVLGPKHGWWKPIALSKLDDRELEKRRIKRLTTNKHRVKDLKRIARQRIASRREWDDAVKEGLL